MLIFKKMLIMKAKYAVLCESDGDDKLAALQLQAVKMLFSKLKEWPKNETARQYLIDALTMGIEETAVKYSTTNGAVRKMLSVRAKEYSEKIGRSTLSLIESGKVKEAIINYKVSWGIIKAKDLFMDCLNIQEKSISTAKIVPLNECMKEIKYLKAYSLPLLMSYTSKVDNEKLYSVLHLLFSDTIAYSKEKELLLSLYTDQISLKEFTEKIT